MAMMAAALAQKEGREREAATTFDKIKGRRRLQVGESERGGREAHARGTQITLAFDEEIQSKSVRSPLLHLLARVIRFCVFSCELLVRIRIMSLSHCKVGGMATPFN